MTMQWDNTLLERTADAISGFGALIAWKNYLPDACLLEFERVQICTPQECDGRGTVENPPPKGYLGLGFTEVAAVGLHRYSSSATLDFPDDVTMGRVTPRVQLIFGENFEDVVPMEGEEWHWYLSPYDQPENPPYISLVITPPDIFTEPNAYRIVVLARKLQILSEDGVLTPAELSESLRRWRSYYDAYWRSRESGNPFPNDDVCENAMIVDDGDVANG